MSGAELFRSDARDQLLEQALQAARKREFRAGERDNRPTETGFIRRPWDTMAIRLDAPPAAAATPIDLIEVTNEEIPQSPKDDPTFDEPVAQDGEPEAAPHAAPEQGTVDVRAAIEEAVRAERAAAEARSGEIRETAYAEGLAAGRAMTESARAAELDETLEDLKRVIAGLCSDNIVDTHRLQSMITAEVRRLTEERVGQALDDMPELLEKRIAALSARVAHLQHRRDLYLAPDDYALLTAQGTDLGATGLILHEDPSLARGEMRLRVGGIEIAERVDRTSDNADV